MYAVFSEVGSGLRHMSTPSGIRKIRHSNFHFLSQMVEPPAHPNARSCDTVCTFSSCHHDCFSSTRRSSPEARLRWSCSYPTLPDSGSFTAVASSEIRPYSPPWLLKELLGLPIIARRQRQQQTRAFPSILENGPMCPDLPRSSWALCSLTRGGVWPLLRR